MKRSFLFVALFLLALSALAQQHNQTDAKGRKQGLWIGYYANGQKRYEGEFKNDKCKGTFKYYDEQGNLKATNEFDRSGEKALNKTYAPNGRVVATGFFVKQKKEGEWKYFDKETAQLLLSEENKDGQVEGWSRLYNPRNGVLAEETHYRQGVPDGECRKYSDTGVLLMECHYRNGVLDGPSKSFYPNGLLKEEGWYAKGEKVGRWKTYNEDGDMIAEESYEETR